MLRKIVLPILVIFLSFGFLIGAKSSVLTHDEYKTEIAKLEKDIEQLELEINSIKNDVLKLENEYKTIEAQFEGLLTKEDMYDWLNQCNIYNVRANMKIEAKHYDSVFGFTTKEQTYSGNGFIFCAEGNTKYVLTTYFLTNDKGYQNVSYTLYDAFQTKYSATLYKSSEQYGIAILKFTDNYANDLYVAPLAKNNPQVSDPVCNIYSLDGSAYNHMNFSKIDGYGQTTYFEFDVFSNEIDTKSSIYGCMSVDIEGKVVGMVSITNTDTKDYCKSIPVTKIIEYLKTVGFKFN